MSESSTETAIRFMGELAHALKQGEGGLAQYEAEWLDVPELRQKAIKFLLQAQHAMQIVGGLGEYIIEHYA